jgi:RNA polymerase sigma factor (sigma-70 family)
VEEIDPDLGILQRVAAGDVESFGVLMQRHERRLHQLCARLLGDAEGARDAVQEVFLKAFRNAAGFKPQGKVSTWLYRIAVNHCFNRLRRQRLARFFSFGDLVKSSAEDEPVEFDPADQQPDAESALEARERWRRTRAAIDALPENQRLVVLLAKFEGLSYKEIAQVLEITEGAVESRLVRAMRTLSANDAQEKAKPRV